jgi:protein-tyrosine-phosphatase/predicted Zn-dependent protease with MMP-like domain
MARVLFFGKRDAARSQMCDAFFRSRGGDRHQSESVGLMPAERIQQEVIEAMSEVGIDLSERRPQGIENAEVERPNVVVIVSSHQNLPVSAPRSIEWDLLDPHGLSIAAVREIRNEIEARVEQLIVELDVAEDDRLARFEALVADAIDGLPPEFQKILETVAVVVSDLGTDVHAYGQYFGDGVARGRFEDRIVIYRDTLERDFGGNQEVLAKQVERTLRHELAHHLGWGERGVGGLGL